MARNWETKREWRTAGAGTLVILGLIVLLMLMPTGAGPAHERSAAGLPMASGGLGTHTDVIVARNFPAGPDATPACLPSQLCPSLLLAGYSMTGLIASSGFNGTKQVIGIFDACGDPTLVADLKAFDTAWSLKAPPALGIIKPDGSTCTSSGWAIETALDVEWAHVMAPGAAIDLFETATTSTSDFYSAWNYAHNHTAAHVFSNSWGAGAECSTGLNDEAAWLSSHGNTVLAATGDSGSWGYSTGIASQQPADCPQVTAVGGTTFNVSGTGVYHDESAWHGSGGGYATWAEPSWQKNVHISDPGGSAYTGKPDVSADANPSTGVLVYEAGGWLLVGGTSLATPLWAGFLTDVNSWRVNFLGYPLLGQVNPFLYQDVYGAFGHEFDYLHGAMHDIKGGNNSHSSGGPWSASVGWDPATGIGSFSGLNLDYVLANDITA